MKQITFINSFQSEWLKRKRSLAAWLVVVGAFFTPSIILLVRIKGRRALPVLNLAPDFWQKLWTTTWESMAVILLPVGIIMATGLITQLEFKNTAWKQLHTTPQAYTTIFFAKLSVILVMMVELFILFNLGMCLSAIIPSIIFHDVPMPTAPIPYKFFLKGNINYFIDCLPVLALQYLISLQFKNFLVPIGVGFIIWVLGIGMVSWQHSYVFPYVHSSIDFLISSGHLKREMPLNLQLLAAIYFTVFTISGWVLYVTKRDKG
ncbi:MAG TPA: ABC transporter permease [Pyrinomonadaceae bacterium]|nr:ABC transporter permease [Pyrinomonadaceae bacterium]